MKTVNFGSLNIDHVYRVDSFILPGETKPCIGYEILAGGKGLNQSIALGLSGVEVFHAGYIGNNADFLQDILKDKGVNTDYLVKYSAKPGHAIIQVDDGGQNCILLYKGTNGLMSEEYVDGVLSNFSAGDIVVLQNETNMVPYIMREAHKKGMRIAFNAAPISSEVFSYPLELVDWLFVNEIEGAFLAGNEDPNTIIRKLMARYHNACIVLTLGDQGSMAGKDGNVFSESAFKVKIEDTTAAGDTFTGYFLSAIGEGWQMPKALRFASAASALCVARPGAAQSIPNRCQVEEFLEEQ